MGWRIVQLMVLAMLLISAVADAITGTPVDAVSYLLLVMWLSVEVLAHMARDRGM